MTWLQILQKKAQNYQTEREKAKDSRAKARRSQGPEFETTKDKVKTATERYQNLKSTGDGLMEKLVTASDRQKTFTETLGKLQNWLSSADRQVSTLEDESVQGAPSEVQDRLDQVKSFNAEAISQGKEVEALKREAKILADSMKDLGADQASLHELESSVQLTSDRLSHVMSKSTSKANDLQTALVESQGVQEGLENLLSWLRDMENVVKRNKAISLNQDTLSGQIQDSQMALSDLDSHRPSVQSVNQSARALLKSGTDPRKMRDIDRKVNDLNERVENLTQRCKERAEDLMEISDILTDFHDTVHQYEDWLVPTLTVLDSKDTSQLDTATFKDKIEEISSEAQGHARDIERIQELGKNLVQSPKTAEVGQVKDKVAECQRNWKDFQELLGERKQEAEQRERHANQYELVRDEVVEWLTGMEVKMESLDPVAIDVEVIEAQIEELRVSILPVTRKMFNPILVSSIGKTMLVLIISVLVYF